MSCNLVLVRTTYPAHGTAPHRHNSQSMALHFDPSPGSLSSAKSPCCWDPDQSWACARSRRLDGASFTLSHVHGPLPSGTTVTTSSAQFNCRQSRPSICHQSSTCALVSDGVSGREGAVGAVAYLSSTFLPYPTGGNDRSAEPWFRSSVVGRVRIWCNKA